MDDVKLHHYRPDFLRRFHWHVATWAIALWCLYLAAHLADRIGGQGAPANFATVLQGVFLETFLFCFLLLIFFLSLVFDKPSAKTCSVRGQELCFGSTRKVQNVNLASAWKVVVRRRQSGEIAGFRIRTGWWLGWLIFAREDMEGLLEEIKGVIPDNAQIVEKRVWLDLESPWNVIAWGLASALVVFSSGILFYKGLGYLIGLL